MAKLTAIVMTLIGAILVLKAGGWYTVPYAEMLIGLGWLVAGIAKIKRAYKM